MYPLPTHTSTQSLERRKTAGEGSKDSQFPKRGQNVRPSFQIETAIISFLSSFVLNECKVL